MLIRATAFRWILTAIHSDIKWSNMKVLTTSEAAIHVKEVVGLMKKE